MLNDKCDEVFTSSVKEFITHPNHKYSGFQYDIALLKLVSTVPYNSTSVKPINLRTLKVQPGNVCLVCGWGATEYGGRASPILRGANVTIQSIQTCNSTTSYNGLLHDKMICAGPMEGGVDACQVFLSFKFFRFPI